MPGQQASLTAAACPASLTLLLQLAYALLVLLGCRRRQRQQQAVPGSQPLGQLQLKLVASRPGRRPWRRRLWLRINLALTSRLSPCRRFVCDAGSRCGLLAGFSCGKRVYGRGDSWRCRRGKVAGPQVEGQLLCYLPASGTVQQEQALLLPRLGPSHCKAGAGGSGRQVDATAGYARAVHSCTAKNGGTAGTSGAEGAASCGNHKLASRRGRGRRVGRWVGGRLGEHPLSPLLRPRRQGPGNEPPSASILQGLNPGSSPWI